MQTYFVSCHSRNKKYTSLACTLSDLLQDPTEKWIVLSAINLPQPYKMVDIVPVLY
jgi:hypothetical protein